MVKLDCICGESESGSREDLKLFQILHSNAGPEHKLTFDRSVLGKGQNPEVGIADILWAEFRLKK